MCPSCGSEIEDRHRPEMNRQGRYLAPGERVDMDGEIRGETPESDTASFWVSGLCSPWRTWGQRAKALLEAQRSGTPGRVQAIVNTAFGELYQEQGEAPDWKLVAGLRGGYESGTVPQGVRLITCGVDVQKNRLVYAVRGWGVQSESWLIEHGELWGETEHPAVWDALGNLLQRGYGGRQIRSMFVDSGFNTGSVYAFCRRFRGRAFAAKGHDSMDRPIKLAKVDVTQAGRVIKGGVSLWHLDSDYFKTWVHTRLTWPVGEPGAFHLPSNTTDDYCKQLVAEQRLVKPTGRVLWIKTAVDNHFLDAEALNAAAAHSLSVYNLRPQAEASAQPQADPEQPQTATRPGRQQPRSSWINVDRGSWFRR